MACLRYAADAAAAAADNEDDSNTIVINTDIYQVKIYVV